MGRVAWDAVALLEMVETFVMADAKVACAMWRCLAPEHVIFAPTACAEPVGYEPLDAPGNHDARGVVPPHVRCFED